MYDSSLFSDPVFLVTWQVHLAVVILFSVLGLWWGANREAWHLGPLLLCLGLWLFIPIEAAEPVIVLLIYVPLLALGVGVCERWTKPEGAAASPAKAGSIWRFGLADLLWFTLLVGLLTALLTQCWRMPWMMHWPDPLISGVCFLIVGLASVVVARQRRLKWRIVSGAMALGLVVAAAGIHYFFVIHDWLLIKDWALISMSFDLGRMLFGKDNPARPDIFLIQVASFLEYSLSIGLAVPLLVSQSANKPRRLWTLRIAAGCGLGVLIAIAGIAYFGVLTRPIWPVEQWLARNDREALRSLLERHEELNPRKPPYPEDDAPAGRSHPQSVTDLFDELDELLEDGQFTLFDSRTDRATFNLPSAEVHGARSLALALGAQARADWAAGRRDEALRRDMLGIRLGAVLQQRGVFIHSLIGGALEGISIARVAEVRGELTPRQSRRLESFLAELATMREPAELLMQRELVYNERSLNWRGRLAGAVRRLLGQDELEVREPIIRTLNRRDMLVALVRTDLALRRYRQTHYRWPAHLSQLVPGQLPLLPLDPWSQQPLVYRPTDDGFLLYSVGQNGLDDGGDAGGFSSDRKDFDLDSWIQNDR